VPVVDIRSETPKDVPAIHAVNTAAFATRLEADLVDTLRKTAGPLISLVADDRGKIIGHILFSPVTLSGQRDVQIMGLAPMALRSFARGSHAARTLDMEPSW
jgi:putative acetyltransferase